MTNLELKIPPPVIALSCAAFAWLLAWFMPGLTYLSRARVPIAAILVVAGVSLALSGVLAFRRAKTTPNPHTPERATSIVRSGPYRFTRNPMYLGLTVALLGICAYLGNPMTLLAVVALVMYLTRFQIIPEERILRQNFGETYSEYAKSVRRWL